MEVLKLVQTQGFNPTELKINSPLILKDLLKKNIDYGYIKGYGKPSLLKSGAEKLRMAYGLSIKSLDCINEIFDIENKIIDVTYKCVLVNCEGETVGISDGNANSEEPKFKYRFRKSNMKPSYESAEKLKKEGKGKWGMLNGNWFWYDKILNPDILGLKNIIKKIAQKRAFVGAVLMATCTSDLFSQE